jgi:hypothetical protein
MPKRIRENKPSKDRQGHGYWPKVYVTSNGNSDQQERDQQGQQPVFPPLIQTPSVNPQLILSLCTISIATCNKLFEIMTPFNGDKIRPRLVVKAGNKTFSWLFDTGAAVTCMNKKSFDLAFGHSKLKQISKPQSCVAASGDKMSSYGVFEVDLLIKGRKFTHPVNVIQELNENIIGIDFIHSDKLTYDVISCKVKFAGARTNSIAAYLKTQCYQR